MDDNPWRRIPAVDYEGHMSSPNVGQLQFLNDYFKSVLLQRRPTSILVVGCATGNGFEHIDVTVTGRVVAVDINNEYLEILKSRYGNTLNRIEIMCADINICQFKPASFDLIHCALLFEYVDVCPTLANIAGWLTPDGCLSTILQLADPTLSAVTETPYVSLKQLETLMHLLNPSAFDAMASSAGMTRQWEEVRQLESGKRFRLSHHVRG